jgi:hypothetical protein
MTIPSVDGFASSKPFTPCRWIRDWRYIAGTIPRNLSSGRKLEEELTEEIHHRRCLDLGGLHVNLHHHSHHLVVTPNPSMDLHVYFVLSIMLDSYYHNDVVCLHVGVVASVLGEMEKPQQYYELK